MSDLEPRTEFKKPQTVRLEPPRALREPAVISAAFRNAGGPRPAAIPPGPGPFGTLIDASVTVKFREGTGVRFDPAAGAFVRALKDGARAARMTRIGLSDATLSRDLGHLARLISDARVARPAVTPSFADEGDAYAADVSAAEKRAGRELADLGLYHCISVPAASVGDLEGLVNELNAHDSVEVAYANPVPHLPEDLSPVTPAFGGQGYLGAAPVGVDALFARSLPGGRGEGVRVIDVEFAWHLDHEDLPRMFFNGAGVNLAISNFAEHGTAVLGVMGALENAYGYTGIAPAASYGVNTWLTVGLFAGAIESAAARLRRGDVLVIEVHVPGPTTTVSDVLEGRQTGFLPAEVIPGVFDVVRRATARGVVVVAAAGNGAVDLDAPLYGGQFDRARWDSGAILVGAGTPGERKPESFTNHGARVDVHGWGSGVETLGYGAVRVPGAEADVRQWYTRTFSGTSSATPIVAGAVAVIQGVRTRAGQEPLSPAEVRALLRDTGTPQASDARKIGPLPNLRAALATFPQTSAPPSTWPSLGGVLTSPPVVGVQADRALQVFCVGTDGRMWVDGQTRPGVGFQGWAAMTTEGIPSTLRFVGRPAVAPSADGRLELFVLGDDRHLWHAWQTSPNGPWSRWEDMGGEWTSDPAVGINDNGRIEVFIRGANHALYHNWQMWPNGAWHTFGWQHLGGNLQGAPAVTSNEDRRLQVFVRGTGDALQTIAQRTPGGEWGGWAHIGGAMTGDPAALLASTSLGKVWQVLARGADGKAQIAWQTAPNGGFTGPVAFSDDPLVDGSRVATLRMADGGLGLFARFADGTIRHRRQHPVRGTWTSWTTIGAGATSDLDGALDANGAAEVFARGARGDAIQRIEP